MGEPIDLDQSPHERRKTAPHHYWSRARNARYSAALLNSASLVEAERIADSVNYAGSTATARHEGFLREMGIALELVLKANICALMQTAPMLGRRLPHTHRLKDLWCDAELGPLTPKQEFQLLRMTSVLYWSGRYPTATSEKQEQIDSEEMARIEDLFNPPQVFKTISIRTSVGTDFEILESLYSAAETQLTTRLGSTPGKVRVDVYRVNRKD